MNHPSRRFQALIETAHLKTMDHGKSLVCTEAYLGSMWGEIGVLPTCVGDGLGSTDTITPSELVLFHNMI